MDEQGMKQVAKAFIVNDPYFPDRDTDEGLWELFKKRYLEQSQIMVAETTYPELPRQFIDLVLTGRKAKRMKAEAAGLRSAGDYV